MTDLQCSFARAVTLQPHNYLDFPIPVARLPAFAAFSRVPRTPSAASEMVLRTVVAARLKSPAELSDLEVLFREVLDFFEPDFFAPVFFEPDFFADFPEADFLPVFFLVAICAPG
jgi:hypothetical protein